MLNGFYVKGLATGWNIDGSGGLQAAGNSYLVVRDVAWSSVVGCTANPLAGPLTTAQLQTQVSAQLVHPLHGCRPSRCVHWHCTHCAPFNA